MQTSWCKPLWCRWKIKCNKKKYKGLNNNLLLFRWIDNLQAAMVQVIRIFFRYLHYFIYLGSPGWKNLYNLLLFRWISNASQALYTKIFLHSCASGYGAGHYNLLLFIWIDNAIQIIHLWLFRWINNTITGPATCWFFLCEHYLEWPAFVSTIPCLY